MLSSHHFPGDRSEILQFRGIQIMAVCYHVKFRIYMRLTWPISVTKPNSVPNGANCNRDMADFRFFKIAAARHLIFTNSKCYLHVWFRGPSCIIVHNFIRMGQTVADILQIFDILRWLPIVQSFTCWSNLKGQYASLCDNWKQRSAGGG